MKSSYVPLIFLCSKYLNYQIVYGIRHVIEMHLDYDTFFRFRCGFAI